MGRINEQRRREQLQARQHQKMIAENGTKEVAQVEVDAAFVGVAHALEKAETAFVMSGDKIQSEASIQEDALRRVHYEQLRCKYFVDRQDAAEDARRRELDEGNAISTKRASWAQVWLASAVGLATVVQTGVAVLGYRRDDAAVEARVAEARIEGAKAAAARAAATKASSESAK